MSSVFLSLLCKYTVDYSCECHHFKSYTCIVIVIMHGRLIPSKDETLAKRWSSVGPPSATLGQQ